VRLFRLLGCSAVLVDQAAEDLPALDPGSDIHCMAGPARRCMLQALMGTMAVIVAGELGQHLAEMPFAEDQQVIQALPLERTHEPLRI
jgi:hypothetical protein